MVYFSKIRVLLVYLGETPVIVRSLPLYVPPQALAEEGRWAYRQSLSTVVDFTSGMNLYPDLRLCKNSADDYNRSIATIEGVLSKMATLRAGFSSYRNTFYVQKIQRP